MKISRIITQDDIQQVLPVDKSLYQTILTFRGLPKLKGWSAVEFYVYNPMDRLANFFQFGSNRSVLVMDKTANEQLLPFWSYAGELLPIFLEDGRELFILNVTEVVNMLNQKATEFDYYPDGTRGRILKPVFHSTRNPESSIFKIPETAASTILTYTGVKADEDEFVTAYNESGFTGLEFVEIFNDN